MKKDNKANKEYIRPTLSTKVIELGVFGDYSDDDCDHRNRRGHRGGWWGGWWGGH